MAENSSTADELQKLKKLLDDKVITKKEFKEQKKNIIKTEKSKFIISKKASAGLTTIYIDDINKKFTFKKPGKGQIYNYNDLLDFELDEDGSSVMKGKGIATAVGGLTFGVLGAMVGASGKRKNEATCLSMNIRILVNDLQNPQIVIKIISTEVKKKSSLYKLNKSVAQNFTAILQYIQSNANYDNIKVETQ